jgi:hypothetical protein
MDGAYAHLAACYKRTTDHCIAELNGCLTPGAWLKSSCLAGCFFQESLSRWQRLAQGRIGLSDRHRLAWIQAIDSLIKTRFAHRAKEYFRLRCNFEAEQI